MQDTKRKIQILQHNLQQSKNYSVCTLSNTTTNYYFNYSDEALDHNTSNDMNTSTTINTDVSVSDYAQEAAEETISFLENSTTTISETSTSK